jgi:hypothetical protein
MKMEICEIVCVKGGFLGSKSYVTIQVGERLAKRGRTV